MNDSSIAVRYAKALFESAKDQKITEEVLQDLNSIANLIRQVKIFKDLIDSPVIQISEKIRLFGELFKGNSQDLTYRFLELITRNKRESYLPDVIRKYLQLYRSDKGIVSATLTTVIEADKELANQISVLLGEKYNAEVELNHDIDPEIVGGFILRVEGEQLDASVRAELKNIKRELDKSVMY